MSFATDFAALKTAISDYANLVKGKFTTVVFLTQIGAANGVAPLDATSKIPAVYLPSYVDGVLEFANFASFPAVGETGKIYIDLTLDPVTNTNPQYRWTGSAYFRINNSVGSADVANKLAAARSIAMTGDGTWSVSFDGSGNVTAAMTLANTGIVAGTYTKLTINSKGQATGGSTLEAADIPSLDWSKITSGKPTTLSGYGISMTAANVTGALGFTPVQQGGGASQGTNKVYIGWMTSQLGLQVDSTNFGALWPINVSGSAATANAVNSSNNYQMNSLGVNTAPSGTPGEIRATGNIQGYYSDERLKDVLGPIENALDKICSLTGFIYVNNEIAKKYGYTSEAEQVGVGAGAVKKILPQIVLPAPFDIAQREDGSEYSKTGENYMTVMYDKLIPLVIEAIKELRQEVESLKTQKY